nr:putative phage abortive infection protein [Pseudomonas gingeri]
MAIVCVLLVVVGIYAAYYNFLYQGYLVATDKDGALVGVRSGTFGDAFGTLNAFFSGLAFSGVLITILLQRRDLVESQEQNAKQQAESQFYNILSLQQQVIQGFDLHKSVPNSQHTIQGRDCFRDWGGKLITRHSELDEKYSGEFSSERALEAYQKILKSHQGDLGLYFRSLYSVFRFVENNKYVDKKNFGLVVRSLLSDYELVFLFYNCLSVKGEKFKRFAKTYALFDNLDVDLLIARKHVLFMDKEAYGENEEALGFFS